MSTGRLRITRSKPMISRLRKNTGQVTAVNYRYTNPGTAAALANHGTMQRFDDIFDPTHPAARVSQNMRRNMCPRWEQQKPFLSLYGFPKAFVTKPEHGWFDPPYPTPKYPERGPEWGTGSKVNMSLAFVTSQKVLILHQPIRSKIKRRIRTAVELILTRGATGTLRKGRWEYGFNDKKVGAQAWLVPDWCYVCRPTNEIYRMPMPQLISLVRDGLMFIRKRALTLEETWSLRWQQREKKKEEAASMAKGSVDRTTDLAVDPTRPKPLWTPLMIDPPEPKEKSTTVKVRPVRSTAGTAQAKPHPEPPKSVESEFDTAKAEAIGGGLVNLLARLKAQRFQLPEQDITTRGEGESRASSFPAARTMKAAVPKPAPSYMSAHRRRESKRRRTRPKL